ncbi:type II secretion system F family protein [Paenibacillus sp.]|uniref:type II secretion system F family protein n=1 Tax=Paenibacillus sp. TaxID=58172 RepID=UPI002D4252B0|nr:type II secretion system F family protein [Paenibacillus sp.]HZG56053.1 type II secretion system F family protein [Paenibacillus sp.]
MGRFKYVAVDQHGVYNKGTLEASSLAGAVEALRERGLWPIRCFDPGASIWHREIKFGGPKVKTQHFTVFCRQLSTLYKAGVNMVEAVRVLAEQSESKEFRKVLTGVAEDLKRGSQLSAAAAQYPTVFTAVFVNMVRAGEASGNLDEMLSRLAIFYEKEHNTREKVKSAMVYPVLMLVIMVLVVTAMMLFIIPRFVSTFSSMGLELPLPTRIVIAMSGFIQGYWYAVIAGLFVPAILVQIMKRIPKGPYVLDWLRLKMPVFGVLAQKQALARFGRVFSSLYGAAIPMLQTLQIVASVVDNRVVSKVIMDSREHIRGGESIADPYRKSWVFPPMVVQMLAIGEKSGSVDSMMAKVADFYEADVDQLTDRLKAALEPIMIVLLAGVVGGIVLAVMLPTFSLFNNI